MIYLYLEDIVANALIEINKVNGTRAVSLDFATKYGEKVLDELKQNGYFAKMKLGEDAIKYFETNYSLYFTRCQINEKTEYYLNSDRTIEEIDLKFRKTLPEEVSSLLCHIDINDIYSFDEVSLKNHLLDRLKEMEEGMTSKGSDQLLKREFVRKKVR